MKDSFQKITFQGNEYILVGGAITTKELCQRGEVSFAHLYENGQISRFGEIIGSKKNIEFLNETEDVEIGFDSLISLLDNLLSGKWDAPKM